MQINYFPKNNLEKFGAKVYSALVENFSQTFFVGGMVRDLLLNIPIHDIDITTSAKPEEVIKILNKYKIKYSDEFKNFGNITAMFKNYKIEITTFRKDIKGESRYPKVIFTNSYEQDSNRRDFTINSLYLSLKNNTILDPQKGLIDFKNKIIRFIGKPQVKIKQDPLRILRALRFALVLNFKIENRTMLAIQNNYSDIKKLTKTKIEKEINKIKNKKMQKIIFEVINNPNCLDKYFK